MYSINRNLIFKIKLMYLFPEKSCYKLQLSQTGATLISSQKNKECNIRIIINIVQCYFLFNC